LSRTVRPRPGFAKPWSRSKKNDLSNPMDFA
jgi:hypothetical protein